MHAQFAYAQNRRPDFEAAWREQREGESVPELVRFGRFGEQFERLLEVVPRDQILTVLLDDLREDTRREYLRVLHFLGVEDDGRTEFPRVNARKVHRSRWLADSIDRTPAPLVSAWMRFKDWVGVREVGLLDRLRGLNAKPIRKREIDPELRAEVASAFREDIRLLSDLLQRDLSHWR